MFDNISVSSVGQVQGARCSSVVRAFAHGAMGRRIDRSWWIHSAIYRSTTGVTNAVVCAILSVI